MKEKRNKRFNWIVLSIIFLITFGITISNAQTPFLNEEMQCSVAPIEKIERKEPDVAKNKTSPNQNKVQPEIKKTIVEQKISLLLSNVISDFKNNDLKPISFGNRIRITIDGLDKAINEGYYYVFNPDNQKNLITRFDYKNLVLQVDKYPLKGIHGTYINNNQLEFKVAHLENSRPEWNAILNNSFDISKEVEVSVGCPNGQEIPKKSNFKMTIFFGSTLRIFTVIIPFLILVFSIFKCFTGGLLRASGTTEKRCYSLARTQLAWWFYIIFTSFLALFVITGNYTDIISSQSMILLGIGSLTTLGSSIIDDNITYDGYRIENQEKIKNLENERISIESKKLSFWDKKIALEKNRKELDKYELQSRNIFQDIITDSKGVVNFHRYQIVIWTVLLGFIFIYEVITTFKMPEFDATLLTLQGISSGTYLTLKSQKEIEEKPVKSYETETKATETETKATETESLDNQSNSFQEKIDALQSSINIRK